MRRLALLVAWLALCLASPSLAQTQNVPTSGTLYKGAATPIFCVNPATGATASCASATTPFSRVALLTTTVTLTSTGYTAGQGIGAALQVSASTQVGAQVAQVRVRSVKIAWTTASSAALGAIYAQFFSAAPTTTLTNGSVPTWNGADAVKFQAQVVSSFSGPITSTGPFYDSDGANTTITPFTKTVTTDSSGNINLALFDQGAITYTTPTTATVTVEIEY